MSAQQALRRIRLNRRKSINADAELPDLVRAAFDANATWQQIAAELGVSKARVYQLRVQGR